MNKLPTNDPRKDLVVVNGPSGSGKTALLTSLMGHYGPLMQQAIVETTAYRFPPMENHYRQISPAKFKKREENGEYIAVGQTPEGRYGILMPKDRLSVAVLDTEITKRLVEETLRQNAEKHQVYVLPILLGADGKFPDGFALRFDAGKRPITEIEKGVRQYIDVLIGAGFRKEA